MTVNFEVKGMLARLLATEDLIVEHRKIDTAQFNVHTRVLTLPMWQKATSITYDMLVAHEVSHALYTPDEDWKEKVKVPHQFVNVCEDVRVEKLIKRRYGGLAKTFYSGYQEFEKNDFFKTANKDVSKYNLADRANLYFKIGNFLSIKFSNKEQEIIDIIGDAETFDETLNAAKILYDYCKKNSKESSKSQNIVNYEKSSDDIEGSQEYFSDDEENDSEDVESSFEDDSEDVESSFEDDSEDDSENEEGDNEDGESSFGEDDEEEGDEEKEEDDADQESFSEEGGEHYDSESEPDVETMNSLDENIKELVDSFAKGTTYIEVPKLNMDSVIISNQIIHKTCEESWKNQFYEKGSTKIFEKADAEYLKFKISTQKEVNYLVKEFECRKAADSYARASVSKTGVLDCTKLHTYRYQEDLFKKVTTFANGKNHGLIFILDWSGSMNSVLMDTVKQLYNLVWFCNKVNIPFEVYAFTNEWNSRSGYDENGKVARTPKEHVVHKEREIVVDYKFGLLNLLTSKVKGSVLDAQLKNIYRISRRNSSYDRFSDDYYTPPKLKLSGTPLSESLISLHQILPHFQKKYKLQKVQCVILTDGEAQTSMYYVEHTYGGKSRLGTAGIDDRTYLRDRQTGNVYKINSPRYFSDILVQNLRDKFPNVNFIGMRILTPYCASSFISKYTENIPSEYDKVMQRWKKERSFAITTSAYNTYFGISSSALNNDSEFIVSDNSTKNVIKSAFVKSLRSKKMNKKILSEFISLVV